MRYVLPLQNYHNHLTRWNPVIALDTSPTHLALARHNAALHGLSSRIEFVLADFRSFAARISNATSSSPSASSSLTRKIDVVFLSPPNTSLAPSITSRARSPSQRQSSFALRVCSHRTSCSTYRATPCWQTSWLSFQPLPGVAWVQIAWSRSR
jgi:tRNA1(Val) A37 N6-methylase TrmN6